MELSRARHPHRVVSGLVVAAPGNSGGARLRPKKACWWHVTLQIIFDDLLLDRIHCSLLSSDRLHQIRKLLVPSRPFSNGCLVLPMMRNDVNGDFGGP